MRGRKGLLRLLLTEADIVMLSLLDGPLKITQLQRATGLSTAAIYNNVRKLVEEGLVREERKGSPPIRVLSLTEKGLRLAKLVKNLADAAREGAKVEYEITPE